ncbi:hypothetical protein [Colwellia sp. Bg11-28]|uniref:hypothetical protein n=1 Tax=Colwellia sp. Bg11-28 TaxID=2058305 RepID=UPI0012FF46FC|nr:hypothetical protein [Colwellia sp. Bg11-28]
MLEQFQYKAHLCSNGYSGEYAPAFSKTSSMKRPDKKVQQRSGVAQALLLLV